ncbi:MAG: hypothetical protein ACXVCQ_19230, partial [Bacteriovorax sp.]
MNQSVIFSNSSHDHSKDITVCTESVLFHGDTVDDRGGSAINFDNDSITERVLVSYDYEKMELTVGDGVLTADRAIELFTPYIANKSILLEATTLGVPELFFAIKSLIDSKIDNFLIIYVEPKNYSRTTPAADSFALTELNAGYKPIPNA